MSGMPTPPARYGRPTRGVSMSDVERAADALLRAGERPTIEKVRENLGTGSPNTINPLLDAWWKKLATRLDAGPAALHRLPETVAHVAEALWMQALEEGRRRAEQELHSTTRSLTKDQQDLQVRSHVLTLREGELDSRLRDRERTLLSLETQLQELTLLLRKEHATREALTKRISSLEAELAARRQAAPHPVRRPPAHAAKVKKPLKRAARPPRKLPAKTRRKPVRTQRATPKRRR